MNNEGAKRVSLDDQQLNLLQFYRDEVKHELNLLGMRATILVTCQSFLVVPFAILSTTSNFHVVAPIALAVTILGGYTAWFVREPILAAHRIIAEWLQKQRTLLREFPEEYRSKRDKSPAHTKLPRETKNTSGASPSLVRPQLLSYGSGSLRLSTPSSDGHGSTNRCLSTCCNGQWRVSLH